MDNYFILSTSLLKITDINNIITNNLKIKLNDELYSNINICRQYLDEKLLDKDNIYYGINTGFGSLYNKRIDNNDLQKLQENLIVSHACGMGNKIDKKIAKIMLLLKIKALSHGHSGISIETVNFFIELFNNNIIPVIYEQGSLGASGDLAPLAHLALPLLSKGKVEHNDQIFDTDKILIQYNIVPPQLQAKEGLAILNGTQFMQSLGVYVIMNFKELFSLNNLIASISIDAYNANQSPFDYLINSVRQHRGQSKTSELLQSFLNTSQIFNSKEKEVQDPYSFRCIPQVHGATYQTYKTTKKIFEKEINSVTDNPLIFPNEDKIISGGNFHGQILALNSDFMAIAISELASISERRIYKLISGQRGLPVYLIENGGLNSGFMIVQYTAASIVSQNKQYCTPASVDSIDSSLGQEDHVSMGANSVVKLLKVFENYKRVLVLELLTSMQGLDLRKKINKQNSSDIIEKTLNDFRKKVPFVTEDVEMHSLIKNAYEFFNNLYVQKV